MLIISLRDDFELKLITQKREYIIYSLCYILFFFFLRVARIFRLTPTLSHRPFYKYISTLKVFPITFF